MKRKQNKSKNAQNCKFDLPIWKVAMAYLMDHGATLIPEHTSFIEGLIRARDVDRMSELTDVLGFCYSEPGPAKIVRQLSAFFKKNEHFADEARCFEAARKGFAEAEDLCTWTNLRLYDFYVNEARADPTMYQWVCRMRKHVSDLLGPLPGFLNSLPLGMKITSGATSSRPRAKSLPFLKVSKKACGTSGAAQLLQCFQEYVAMTPWPVAITEANRIALVPKSYKTHRTIAAEPEVNMFFQTAVDTYLKSRLQTRGIDLKDQSRNKELARQGSVFGHLATIDLSMASDTMAHEVVHFLLPHDWCEFLELLRSPNYVGPFGEGSYQKFSSMGNGYTFVLETLIFWAAMKAVQSKVVSVYGDDIIVDSDKYEDAVKILRFLGFVPNQDKSFHVGPFRESCGGDYFAGQDIRPFFVKKFRKLSKPELCHYINGLAVISGAKLAELLVQLAKVSHLPLVPYSDNSRLGVHVSTEVCYKLKILYKDKGRPWQLFYRGYSEKHKRVLISNVKTYLIWWVEILSKESKPDLCPIYRYGKHSFRKHYPRSMAPAMWAEGRESDRLCVTSSVITSSSEKLKRVCWQIPDRQPIHLFWWSDYFLPG
jgi:hypothetical protein